MRQIWAEYALIAYRHANKHTHSLSGSQHIPSIRLAGKGKMHNSIFLRLEDLTVAFEGLGKKA